VVGDAVVDEGWGGGGGGGDAGDVVGEVRGDGLAGGVVVEALGRDGEGGDAGVHFERLPGEDAFGGEIGEDLGVAGSEEGFLGDFAGDLVLSVAVGDVANPGAGEHQRAEDANGADDIVEDALVGPFAEGFGLGFAEAEVDFGAEHLGDAGVAVVGEQLLGAEQAEGVFEVAGHGVLAAFAAGEGEVGDAGAEAAGVEGEHAAVLVVGVGDDVEDGGAGLELAEELLEAEGPGGIWTIDGELAAVARGDALAGEVGGVGEVGWRGCLGWCGRG
jgi:hypothetical protein